MKRSIWNKQIPTILGLILLASSIALVSWMGTNNILFFSKAALQTTPKDVRITNVSDSSFSVSYLTDDQVVGTLSYGTDSSLGKISFDDRDQETGKPTPQVLHHITVKGLTPGTTYFFAINSGQTAYLNNSSPYQVATAPKMQSAPTSQTPLVGKISFPEGMAEEAIVFVKTDSAQTLSLLTKPDGSFTLPMNTLLTSDLSGPAKLAISDIITLLIVGDSAESQVKVNAGQINPVPIVVLSKNYDFTVTSEPLASASASAETSDTESQAQGFPSFGEGTAEATAPPEPQILTPTKNQTFSDQQPEFTGTAQPNQAVTVTIHSTNPVQATVTAGNTGTWTYRPQSPLAPGVHTITIVTKDASGVMKTISQTFTVFAAGSQFTEPSGAPSETPTASPATPTPTAEAPQATPTPLPSPTPTVAPTLLPTSNPSPTEISSLVTPFPTQTPGSLPSTGNNDLPAFLIMTVVMIGVGGAIFLLTRGGIA